MRVASVAALLIVKNEEERLLGCLRSVRSAVDDVIVVDTGSSDCSPLIARDFGARVMHYEWIDDFASARNFAIECCRADWALYIDADERLSENSQSPISRIVNPEWWAADILLKPKVNYTRYRLTRLFRVDPRIRFSGSIHETILPSLEAIAGGAMPSILGQTSIEIDHYGYEGDLHAKHMRNLPLLQKCVEESPNRVFYHFHLTETLLDLNRFEEAYSAGLRGIETAKRFPSEKSRVDAAMICQMLSVSMLDRSSDPIELLAEGLDLHADNYGLSLTRARRDLKFGDPSSSLAIARSLQAIDPDELVPELVAYDRNIFRRYAIEMEIACLAKLGRVSEAVQLVARHAETLAS
jgi:hypothetical protein